PAPCAMSIWRSVNLADRGAVIVVIVQPSRHCRCSAAMHVIEVRGARAFRRHHQRADGALRRALARKELALMRLQDAFEDLAALRRLRIGHRHAPYVKASLSVPHPELGSNLESRLGDEPEPSPLEVRPQLEYVSERVQGRKIAVPRHRASILVFDVGSAVPELSKDHRE